MNPFYLRLTITKPTIKGSFGRWGYATLSFPLHSNAERCAFALLKFESKKSFNNLFIKMIKTGEKPPAKFCLRKNIIREIKKSPSINDLECGTQWTRYSGFILKANTSLYFDSDESENEFILGGEKVKIIEHSYFPTMKALRLRTAFYVKAIKIFLSKYPHELEDAFEAETDDSAALLYRLRN